MGRVSCGVDLATWFVIIFPSLKYYCFQMYFCILLLIKLAMLHAPVSPCLIVMCSIDVYSRKALGDPNVRMKVLQKRCPLPCSVHVQFSYQLGDALCSTNLEDGSSVSLLRPSR